LLCSINLHQVVDPRKKLLGNTLEDNRHALRLVVDKSLGTLLVNVTNHPTVATRSTSAAGVTVSTTRLASVCHKPWAGNDPVSITGGMGGSVVARTMCVVDKPAWYVAACAGHAGNLGFQTCSEMGAEGTGRGHIGPLVCAAEYLDLRCDKCGGAELWEVGCHDIQQECLYDIAHDDVVNFVI